MDLHEQQEIIREYYRTKFTLNELKRVIRLEAFENREFGFRYKDGFVRNLSFESLGKLHRYIAEKAPFGAFVGALYNEPPTLSTPIHTLKWIGREFIIDLDLDEYDSVRTCGCRGGDQLCTVCWSLVNEAILFVDETLREDFGFNDVTWVFSGRRGVHCWVRDDIAFNMDSDLRSSIMEYMSILKGSKKNIRIQDRKDLSATFIKRIYKIVANSFIKYATIEDLISLGYDKAKATKLITFRDQYGLTKELTTAIINKAKHVGALDEIFRRRYPRLDTKVSIDTRRLLRMPGSIHEKTGKKCRILDISKELDTFNPLLEPSIYES